MEYNSAFYASIDSLKYKPEDVVYYYFEFDKDAYTESQNLYPILKNVLFHLYLVESLQCFTVFR